jgi:hypothetical protein
MRTKLKDGGEIRSWIRIYSFWSKSSSSPQATDARRDAATPQRRRDVKTHHDDGPLCERRFYLRLYVVPRSSGSQGTMVAGMLRGTQPDDNALRGCLPRVRWGGCGVRVNSHGTRFFVPRLWFQWFGEWMEVTPYTHLPLVRAPSCQCKCQYLRLLNGVGCGDQVRTWDAPLTRLACPMCGHRTLRTRADGRGEAGRGASGHPSILSNHSWTTRGCLPCVIQVPRACRSVA